MKEVYKKDCVYGGVEKPSMCFHPYHTTLCKVWNDLVSWQSIDLSRLTWTAPSSVQFQNVDKPNYPLPSISYNTPGDVITTALEGMWEVLSNGNLVELETTFRCVRIIINFLHIRLVSLHKLRDFKVETHKRPCNSYRLPTQMLASSRLNLLP